MVTPDKNTSGHPLYAQVAQVGDTIVGLAAELAADEGGRWTGGRLIRLYSYYYYYYYYLGGRYVGDYK